MYIALDWVLIEKPVNFCMIAFDISGVYIGHRHVGTLRLLFENASNVCCSAVIELTDCEAKNTIYFLLDSTSIMPVLHFG